MAISLPSRIHLLMQQWKDYAIQMDSTDTRGTKVFYALIRNMLQLAENQLMLPGHTMIQMLNLDTAEGVWLDYIGERLGFPRPVYLESGGAIRFGYHGVSTSRTFGEAPFFSAIEEGTSINDDNYRILLRGAAVSLYAQGNIEDIREAAAVVYEGGADVVADVPRAVIAKPPAGTRARLTASISDGEIDAITIANRGNNYREVPTVTISAPDHYAGIQAIATVTLNASNRVDEVEIVEKGSGYTSVPTIVVSPPEVPATAIVVLNNGVVSGLTVIDGGNGYTTAPMVEIEGGGGTGATATATVTSGSVSGFTVTNGGSNYSFSHRVDIFPYTNNSIVEVLAKVFSDQVLAIPAGVHVDIFPARSV